MPSVATGKAARRAFTYSFGSINSGSLVYAFISTIRQEVSLTWQQEAQIGTTEASIAFRGLGFFIGLIYSC